MVSILIATKNRSKKIISCVRSLLGSSYSDFEIIVIDQSTTLQTQEVLQSLRDNRVIYIRFIKDGKSAALNRGVECVRGSIIAFTDDDCIVDNYWISTIHLSFIQNPHISAVFGKTLSYRPYQHKNQFCPCTFSNTNKSLITRPCVHYKYIGFGNNMAIRRSIFDKIGMFKEWLGPGSIGSNSEDAEFALRLLSYKKKILYNPLAVVYHNKWLTYEEMRKQNLSYTCGEMACYGYFLFNGYSFAKPIVFNNIRDSFGKVKQITKYIFRFQWNKCSRVTLFSWYIEVLYRSRGLLVGFIYSLIDPIK